MAVLAARTNHQRQEIAAKYQQEHDKVIIDEHVTSHISYVHFVRYENVPTNQRETFPWFTINFQRWENLETYISIYRKFESLYKFENWEYLSFV